MHMCDTKEEKALDDHNTHTSQAKMMTNGAFFGSLNDNVATPKKFYSILERVFQFDHDPCPLGGTGGLDRNLVWGKRNYVNPPYSEVPVWLNRVLEEREKGNMTVMLVPFRGNSNYWKEKVWNKAEAIYFIADRLVFQGYTRPLTIPLCLLVYGASEEVHSKLLDQDVYNLFYLKQYVGNTPQATSQSVDH